MLKEYCKLSLDNLIRKYQCQLCYINYWNLVLIFKSADMSVYLDYLLSFVIILLQIVFLMIAVYGSCVVVDYKDSQFTVIFESTVFFN